VEDQQYVDGIGRLNFERDSLAGQGFHEDRQMENDQRVRPFSSCLPAKMTGQQWECEHTTTKGSTVCRW